MDEIIINETAIISAITEVKARTFQKVKGKKHTWYIAIQKNAGDYIYCASETNRGGFGGSEIEFNFPDGTCDKVKGPWHSNTTALFNDTGIDLSDQHATFGVICKEIEHSRSDYQKIAKGIFHIDDDWVVGKFNRIEDLAQKIANEKGERVKYYSQSTGGSSSFYKDPE